MLPWSAISEIKLKDCMLKVTSPIPTSKRNGGYIFASFAGNRTKPIKYSVGPFPVLRVVGWGSDIRDTNLKVILN